jgi:hypothetical protein
MGLKPAPRSLSRLPERVRPTNDRHPVGRIVRAGVVARAHERPPAHLLAGMLTETAADWTLASPTNPSLGNTPMSQETNPPHVILQPVGMITGMRNAARYVGVSVQDAVQLDRGRHG